MWYILIIWGCFPNSDFFFGNGLPWLAHHKTIWNFGDFPNKEVFTPNIKTKFKYSPNHDLLFYLVEMKQNVGSCKEFTNYLEIGLNTQWLVISQIVISQNHLEWSIQIGGFGNIDFAIGQMWTLGFCKTVRSIWLGDLAKLGKVKFAKWPSWLYSIFWMNIHEISFIHFMGLNLIQWA